MPSDMSDHLVFRTEAVEHHLHGPSSHGLIKASPPWTWFILTVSAALILAAALFLTFTSIDVPVRAEGMVRLANGGAEVVAYMREAPGGLRQGKRVRMQLKGSMHAAFASLEGRIARIEPIGEPAANGSAHAQMRIDIALDQPSNGPRVSAGLDDGIPVSVLLTSHKIRLITLIRDSLF